MIEIFIVQKYFQSRNAVIGKVPASDKITIGLLHFSIDKDSSVRSISTMLEVW